MQQFEAEHARSEQVVQKLQAVAKQNRARNSRSKLNEHKFEYTKQSLAYNREVYFMHMISDRRKLEDELKSFMRERGGQPEFGTLLALSDELDNKTELLSKTLFYNVFRGEKTGS